MALLPIYVVVFLLLWLDMREWPLFTQERVGLHERLFTIYKFKTMRTLIDGDGNLLEDYLRITKLGAFVRSFSLDELPQLFNILSGTMSFVGPRPLPAIYLPLYSSEQRLRHHVRPGITGIAQIRGRNSLSWHEKFDYDLEYVRARNWQLDVKILLQTFIYVLRRTGVNQNEHVTMTPFDGTN
jgi:lipopolysaccharide/colanic/teichoic acid biosynthesis glycosyltransferase